ncbi:hypothetical protein MMC30_004174 [Trapelia coarctata]|nr:hypothetical protein [Trapelia coarctata]
MASVMAPRTSKRAEAEMEDIENIARDVTTGVTKRKPKKPAVKEFAKGNIKWMDIAIDDRNAILSALKTNFEDLAIPKGGRSQTILFEGKQIHVGYDIKYRSPVQRYAP